MASFEPWALALLILACIVGSIALIVFLTIAWAKGAYVRFKNNPKTECDIDVFVGDSHPVKSTKVALAHKLRLGNRQASTDAIPLECVDSPHVPGLKVSRKSGTQVTDRDLNVVPLTQIFSESDLCPIVIATIRMGFGHHRLAYSTASWALRTGHPTIFHDLLNIPSGEAELIHSTDELYSKFSRWASELGGPVEKMWGSMLLSGDADALRMASLTASHLMPLLLAYPKDTPIITTHQLCALTAAAIGFTNVVNLVVDNHPQWFLTVPKTLNIVQGPVNYQSFLRMGIDAKELAWAGHWCPYELVTNIDTDCRRRIERCQGRKPVRILIPVGGAGAQKKFIVAFVRALADLVRQGQVQLLLNAGDHVHMKTAFLQVLDECSLDFENVTDSTGVQAFQRRLLSDARVEPLKSVTLFTFAEYFPAVATTDMLCRVADVLSCKPSELAFYCVPKLHIRRVGDHEADSAKRASELGDGTVEARHVNDAMDFVRLFLQGPELLTQMNETIMRNHQIGIYNGCQRAVELALERNSNNNTGGGSGNN